MNTTAALARSITWASSKQSYLTARLLADRDLADDCLRAYAYFRWADDRIDLAGLPEGEAQAFLSRQQDLVERLYRGERPTDLGPEEALLADLIAHDRAPESGLRSFIHNFMAVITFDAGRRGQPISRGEMDAYTKCLATAVMDGLLYFIANGHPFPRTAPRTLAVVGAHITHMLRDTLEDLAHGYINVPLEDLDERGLDPIDPGSDSFQDWVRARVIEARRCFRVGRGYIDTLPVLRARLAGVWYCARFERILTAIERDGYRLRAAYPERRSMSAWLEMAWLGLVVTLQHCSGNIWTVFCRHACGIRSLLPRTTHLRPMA
ncbi:MAG: squalene/phytoene synthase family protein [Anaerolineales bacterium]|nr:squalene/phytoene synthase family protein [Anaerolineales bacterium]